MPRWIIKKRMERVSINKMFLKKKKEGDIGSSASNKRLECGGNTALFFLFTMKYNADMTLLANKII